VNKKTLKHTAKQEGIFTVAGSSGPAAVGNGVAIVTDVATPGSHDS
jgi:hypothetical protein